MLQYGKSFRSHLVMWGNRRTMNGPHHQLSVIDDGHVDSLKSGGLAAKAAHALGPVRHSKG